MSGSPDSSQIKVGGLSVPRSASGRVHKNTPNPSGVGLSSKLVRRYNRSLKRSYSMLEMAAVWPRFCPVAS